WAWSAAASSSTGVGAPSRRPEQPANTIANTQHLTQKTTHSKLTQEGVTRTMHKHKLRSHMARAAGIGTVAITAALVVGAGVASAAPPDPPGGAVPVAPHFYNGNVEGIRDTGSDTTFFMMQRLGDLFTGAGLYGCSIN